MVFIELFTSSHFSHPIELELNLIVKDNSTVKLKIEKVTNVCTQSQITYEKIKVENDINLLKEELDFIDEQLNRNNVKYVELLASADNNNQNITMLNKILSQLKGDLVKYTILFEAMVSPSVDK